ncbi:MAG: SDR family oxidoreductase [Lachnospiraceae bacterium]|nr:SDR family oxidoreductase [Lachnospiraceae bacterium]
MNHHVALITGASRGIGREIALTFARHGYDCIITCRQKQAELCSVCDEISSLGVSCLPFVGDLGCFDECVRLFDEVINRYGHLDVLVNNAGMAHIGLLQDMSPDEWNHLLQTNLSSCFYCSKLAIPLMLKNKSGNILNISSVWGNVGASCEVAYSATKGAVNSLTKALAKELAPSGIRVNAIACGVIDTEMNHCFSDEERAILQDEIPMGRFGTPKEVGEFAYSIVSQASYLTGQVITYDGGWL